LFSLGCVLYRLFTGQLPFRGSDILSILCALAVDPPRPPRHLDPTIPAGLSDLILRLLAKNPADRPPSAHAVAAALTTLERELARCLCPPLQLEIWSEERLIALLQQRFGVRIGSITEDDLLDVRQAIDRAKGAHAFGSSSLAADDTEPLRSQLLWHFGFWRLR